MQYTYGIGIDNPLARYDGDTMIYYHTNSPGSVIALPIHVAAADEKPPAPGKISQSVVTTPSS